MEWKEEKLVGTKPSPNLGILALFVQIWFKKIQVNDISVSIISMFCTQKKLDHNLWGQFKPLLSMVFPLSLNTFCYFSRTLFYSGYKVLQKRRRFNILIFVVMVAMLIFRQVVWLP